MLKIFYPITAIMLVASGSALEAAAQNFWDASGEKPAASQATACLGGESVAVEEETLQVAPQKFDKGTVAAYDFGALRRQSVAAKGANLRSIDFDSCLIQANYDDDLLFYSSGTITVTKVGDDSLAIYSLGNFVADSPIMAKVDWSAGTLEIEPQLMYVSSTYGNCNIVPVDLDASTYDETGKVTGVIDETSITISPWACLILSGTYEGYVLNTYYGKTVIKESNAKMTGKELDSDSLQVDYSYNILVEQVSPNLLKIYNLAGVSSCISVGIRGDKTLSIAPQKIYRSSTYGTYYCYAADFELGYYYTKKKIKGTAADNKLAWNNWIVQTSNGKYYLYRFLTTEIELPFELSYPPAASQSWLSGTGTEADPYLIESIADLILLSDSVNNTLAEDDMKYGKAFAGEYFKLTASIDMSGYLFPPIGGDDEYFRFAGTFDGNGLTLSNLDVETEGLGNCGLFGAVDTVGVIKDLNLVNPVSVSQYYYTGTVAGYCQGTIENCNVTGGEVSGLYCVGGVVGFGGETRNCSFVDGTVTGDTQVGGVIGVTRCIVSGLYSTGSTITCTSSTTSASVGGVVGYISDARGGHLSDCYFDGTVAMTKSGEYAGLILGIAVESTVERCFSTGCITSAVTSSTSAAGGIVGAIQGDTISDCYFAGSIGLASSRTGYIAGYMINVTYSGYTDHSALINCYISGYTASKSLSYDYNPWVGYYDTSTGGSAPYITNCKYDAQMLGLYPDKTGVSTTSEMTTATAWDGYDTSVWLFADGLYPRLQGMSDLDLAHVSAAPIFLASTDQTNEEVTSDFTVSTANSVEWKVLYNGTLGTTGYGLTVNGGSVTLGGSAATDTLYAIKGDISKWTIIKSAPSSMFEGDGTAESPYLLKTKQDLINLSTTTTDEGVTYDGIYFLVTNDIDLEYDEDFKGISEATSETYAFGGILDGGGHTIYRCKLAFGTVDENNTIVLKETYRGFVGRLKADGVIRNLRMGADCDLTFYSYSGTFVGSNYGTVENCRNYADIKALSGTTGGIAGRNQSGGVIRECYNAGNVTTGYYAAAGIVAFNYGTIENCQNDGEITQALLSGNYKETSFNSASGICHSSLQNGTISNVLNTGYIHTYKYVGGILGTYNGTAGNVMVDGSLNLGMLEITTTSSTDALTIGNVVGKIYKEGRCQNNYYDAQVSTELDCNTRDFDGAYGLTTAELISGDTIAGLSTDYWLYEAGKYPVLKSFADETGSKAAANSVVNFNTSPRSDSIKCDATLAQADSLTWAVETGKSFTVDGSTLAMEPSSDLTDVLVATYGTFVKRIPIVAVPDSAEAPTISLQLVDSKYYIVMESATEGASIYYTLDGTEPTTSSSLYADGGVEFDNSGDITVKAFAAKHSHYPSATVTETIIATGISGTEAARWIVEQRYVSATGLESGNPHDGVNIVITTYSDGSTAVTKEVLRAR